MFIVQNNFLKSVIIIPNTEEVSKNNTSASMFGGNPGGSGFTFGSQTPSTQGGWFIFKLARNTSFLQFVYYYCHLPKILCHAMEMCPSKIVMKQVSPGFSEMH